VGFTLMSKVCLHLPNTHENLGKNTSTMRNVNLKLEEYSSKTNQ